MKDKDTGSLSEKPFLDLLLDFHNGSITGSLKLERSPLQKAVYFREGQILFAASNDPKDQLASILVEEGKLGQEQMQVAQARVGPGSPLAKVLTELGYISNRELTDAARLKVEKILTDLYSWSDGSFQFATKSLPKGAIDLELSTAHVILNSMKRIQDRQWVLDRLGSLETVLAPGLRFEEIVAETQADNQSTEVMRLADGTRTIKDIAANVGIGEFEVCKILSAALTLGALERQTVTTGIPDSPPAIDAFDVSIQPEQPSIDGEISPPTIFEVASSADPTANIDNIDAQSETTVFSPDVPPPGQPGGDLPEGLPDSGAAPEAPTGAFDFVSTQQVQQISPDAPPVSEDPPPAIPSFDESEPPAFSPPGFDSLNIHEPEPAEEEEEELFIARDNTVTSGGASTFLKLGIAALVLVALGAVSYFVVWPRFIRPDPDTSTPIVEVPPRTTSTPPGVVGARPTPDPTVPPLTSDVTPGAGPSVENTTTTAESTSPETAAPPPRPGPRPPQSTTTTPTRRQPGTSPAGGASGRELLASGNLDRAAQAFVFELERSPEQFTIAVGLYCDAQNAARTVESAGANDELFVLPAQLNGRTCYRILWGLFGSRESASGAISSIPSGIRSGDSTPVPVSQFLR